MHRWPISSFRLLTQLLINLHVLLLVALLPKYLSFTEGKAVPIPIPVYEPPNNVPTYVANPPVTPGALPIPEGPLKLNVAWFPSYLRKDQPEDSAVFHCKISEQAKDWAALQKKTPGLRTIWERYPDNFFKDDLSSRTAFVEADLISDKKDAENQPLWKNRNRDAAMSSEAFVRQCRGTKVYLLVDDVQGIPVACIWAAEEKKRLLDAGIKQVEKVTVEFEIVEEILRQVVDIGAKEVCAAPSPGGNGKRGNSYPAPSSWRNISSTASIPTGEPLCTPSEGAHKVCICSANATMGGSVTLPMASSIGTNTGEAYNPCPMTTLPPTSTIKPKRSTTISSTAPYFAYTFTDYIRHNVIECQSYTLAYYPDSTETLCAGSSVTLYAPPTPSASVQVGQIKQNVGTVTGTALFTSISSALNKICPTATGDMVSCTEDQVTIRGIDYIAEQAHSYGELVVKVQSSSYNTTKLRDAMIKSAALTAQHSANYTNCRNATYTTYNLFRRAHIFQEKLTICNAAGFAGVQWYDGVQDKAVMYLDAEWNFQSDGGGDFACEFFIDLLNTALEEVAPEFVVGEAELADALIAMCEQEQ